MVATVFSIVPYFSLWAIVIIEVITDSIVLHLMGTECSNQNFNLSFLNLQPVRLAGSSQRWLELERLAGGTVGGPLAALATSPASSPAGTVHPNRALITVQFPFLLFSGLVCSSSRNFGHWGPFHTLSFHRFSLLQLTRSEIIIHYSSHFVIFSLFKFCILEERDQVVLMFELLFCMCFQNGVRIVLL